MQCATLVVANKLLGALMPQHVRTQQFGHIDLTKLDPPQLSPTDERALARTGHDKSAWDEVGWFVRLARTDLDQASPGDLLSLKEEFVALQKVHLRVHTDHPDNMVLWDVQWAVHRGLEELADQGVTFLPEIPIRQRIEYPYIREKLALGGGYKPSHSATSLPDCMSFLHAPPGIGLVAVMGQLLATVDRLIVRCPHCRNIFLQSRRNQEFCSRSCQSVAVMQRRRAEAKALASQKPKTRKKTRQRGGPHGKKTR